MTSSFPVGRIFDRATAFDLVGVLAEVRRELGPNMMLRENVQRRIVISSNVASRDLGSVVEDMRTAVA